MDGTRRLLGSPLQLTRGSSQVRPACSQPPRPGCHQSLATAQHSRVDELRSHSLLQVATPLTLACSLGCSLGVLSLTVTREPWSRDAKVYAAKTGDFERIVNADAFGDGSAKLGEYNDESTLDSVNADVSRGLPRLVPTCFTAMAFA